MRAGGGDGVGAVASGPPGAAADMVARKANTPLVAQSRIFKSFKKIAKSRSICASTSGVRGNTYMANNRALRLLLYLRIPNLWKRVRTDKACRSCSATHTTPHKLSCGTTTMCHVPFTHVVTMIL
jgi:hypothetical protein